MRGMNRMQGEQSPHKAHMAGRCKVHIHAISITLLLYVVVH